MSEIQLFRLNLSEFITLEFLQIILQSTESKLIVAIKTTQQNSFLQI